MCHALPMPSLVLCSRHSTRYFYRDRHVAVTAVGANNFASVQDRHDDTHRFDSKKRVRRSHRARITSYSPYIVQKRRFRPTTAASAYSAHNIEFDNSLIRTRPTVPPPSHRKMVTGLTAGRVPIHVRSAPPAHFNQNIQSDVAGVCDWRVYIPNVHCVSAGSIADHGGFVLYSV